MCWRVPCLGAMVAVGAGGFVTTVGGVKSVVVVVVVVDFVGQVQYSRFFDWWFFFSFRRSVDSISIRKLYILQLPPLRWVFAGRLVVGVWCAKAEV